MVEQEETVCRGQALGMVETQGMVAAVEALDAMAKAARVQRLFFRRLGSGHVTVGITGDVAAVEVAVQAGGKAASKTGEEIVGLFILPRPHPELGPFLQDDGK